MKDREPPHFGGWQANRNPVTGTPVDRVRGSGPPARYGVAAVIIFIVLAGILIAVAR